MAIATATGAVDGLERREFELLNLARFAGAFWVLLYHANLHFGTPDALRIVAPLLEQGVLAMTLFFVLSGFVLAMRYTSFDAPGSARAFYLARLIRLYPVYIFMGVVSAPFIIYDIDKFALYQAHPVLWVLLMCVLLVLAIQAWAPGLFGVWNFGGSWSLSVEAFFYATYPKLRGFLTDLSDRRLCWTILACISAMLLLLLMMVAQDSAETRPTGLRLFYILPLFRFPEFIIGVAVFILCVERGAFRGAFALAAAPMGLAALVLIFSVDLPGLIDYGFLLALPFAMLFVLGLTVRVPAALAGLFNYLGHISYSLYLAQFATLPYYKVFFAGQPQAVSWLAVIGSTFIIANLAYFLLEAPARRGLKKRLVRRGLM